jgi:hypothetical protein
MLLHCCVAPLSNPGTRYRFLNISKAAVLLRPLSNPEAHLVDDAVLDGLDAHRILIDAQHACALTRSRTDTACAPHGVGNIYI